MGIWANWRKQKRSPEEVRAGLASEIVHFQEKIVKTILPGFPPVTLPETNLFASVAMCAMINTTPGKSPEEKERDFKTYAAILIRAIDIDIEEDTQEAQEEFQKVFQERISEYLLPTSYLLGNPDAYKNLDKPLYGLLSDRMGFEESLVDLIETEFQLQVIIRETANRVWDLMQD